MQEDWGFEQQEAEHEQRAAALLAPAQDLEGRAGEALKVFRAVEDDVWQLTKPRFAGYTSRLARIGKETADLEAEARRLLARVEAARDDLGERVVEYDDYQDPYDALLRAHAAIGPAHGIATRLRIALTGLVTAPEAGSGGQARRPAPSAEPGTPPARQGGTARPEPWRVPVVGSAAAGTPNMPAESEGEFLSIPPQNARKGNVVAVRIDGNSMTGDDMLDGDYAIVDKGRREVSDGAIAVVRIGESQYSDLTVKHVWREEDGLLLKPSSPDHRTAKIPPEENPVIEGTVIGVFRPERFWPLRQ